ncbi:MAG TPA: septal ring lytic transglycosylase RlpA family protein [Nevskiaceae bacterium]|nr:septal ring lytic transglycosylase RlpA family protein [Nevskiaceae bacterium]
MLTTLGAVLLAGCSTTPTVPPNTASSYEVNGKTYYVLKNAEGVEQTGYASWYGEKFQGKPTASGVPYDMYGMTAASTVLPLASLVRVTNLGNGKSVIVQVNDRGPFHPGRIIDLSYAAAQQIGMAQVGTAKVHVKVLRTQAPAPPAAPGPVTVASAAPAPAPYLQVGVFADAGNATRLQNLLRARGITETRLVAMDYAGSRALRVLVGPLASAARADQVRSILASAGLPAFPYTP